MPSTQASPTVHEAPSITPQQQAEFNKQQQMLLRRAKKSIGMGLFTGCFIAYVAYRKGQEARRVDAV